MPDIGVKHVVPVIAQTFEFGLVVLMPDADTINHAGIDDRERMDDFLNGISVAVGGVDEFLSQQMGSFVESLKCRASVSLL